MQAAVYRARNEVRPESIPVPAIGPGEALVRVAACGVCGTDIKKIRLGLQEPPRVYGHEMAGTIAALGEGVRGWRVGERVAVYHHIPCRGCHFCRRGCYAQCATYKRTGTTAGFEPAGGGFAEFVRVMDWVVAGGGLTRVPEEVSFEEAAFLEPVNTCLKAVRRAQVGPGDVMGVCGSGAIGLLLAQLARLGGPAVLASDPIGARRAKAAELGATWVVDPTQEDLGARARALTAGRGADAVLVATAAPGIIAQAMDVVRPGGRVVLFAHTHAGEPTEIDAGAVCAAEKDLIGSYSSSVDLNEEAARIVFGRQVDVRSLVTHRFPLCETGEAISRAGTPSGDVLKVMVAPGSGCGWQS
ncbi:MAG: alcohol dehydrogenase catalytic domain-containing protein [Armatimonadetes bacterium]|nr:alcohol dehydrogenase catalytic domain-containing protein [Armatimonadota bacterium]